MISLLTTCVIISGILGQICQLPPRKNIEYVDVTLDYQTEEVRDQRIKWCRAQQVSEIFCQWVVSGLIQMQSELNETTRNITARVTLDHSVPVTVTAARQNGTLDDKIITLIPEEPIHETLLRFCQEHDFNPQDCAKVYPSLLEKAHIAWNLMEQEATCQIQQQIPLVLNGHLNFINMSTSPAVTAAKYCRSHPGFNSESCFSLYEHIANTYQWLNRFEEGIVKLNEPVVGHLYPNSQRVYFEMSTQVEPQDACLVYGVAEKSMWCGSVPHIPVYIVSAPEGYHMVAVVVNESIVDATFFRIKNPTIVVTNFQLNERSELILDATVMDFDPRHPGRVCAVVDSDTSVCQNTSSFENWTAFDKMTLVFPVHQPLAIGKHIVSMVLVANSSKALCISEPIEIDIEIELEASEVTNVSWVSELESKEWGLYSQNGEDGILLSIFANIGETNKFYVEFGVEDGQECNSRIFREKYHWNGLMMDGGYSNPKRNLQQEWIQAETINDLFEKYNVPSEFDLLSIDIDFNDYWVWKAIDLERFSPRVVVVEYNSHIPANESRTVPYSSTGQWDGKTSFFGAGIGALHTLAVAKGYSLVYCESHGVNCFFIRNDAIGFNLSSEIDVAAIHRPPNFFGKGWSYPQDQNFDHQWVWV